MYVIVRNLIYIREPGEWHKHRTLLSGLADGRLIYATIRKDVAVALLLISCYRLTSYLAIKGKRINMLKSRSYVITHTVVGLGQKCCRNECNH